MKQKISITINEKILRDIDSIIDRLIIQNRSQAIEYLIKKAMQETKTAVILAGESEVLSKNKIKNRYTLKIDSQTLIEKMIKKLSDSGFRNIYVIAEHDTLTNIFNLVGDGSLYKSKIEFINEEKTTKGNASALKILRGKIKTTFLVLQNDLVIDHINLLELWKQHIQDKNVATLLVCSKIAQEKTIMYGHVGLERNKVISFIEKPALKNVESSLFFGGIFVAEPAILNYNGDFFELDIFPELAKRNLLGGQITNKEHLHIHTREDLARVKRKIKEIEKGL